ncbi:MAG: NADH-quinone oxidoreductase subunit NuoH [Phycisphaerales bacterium]|nr:NADH-quinone oxidoreductase subunit NuoH [Phycisphaerales bacterium]MCI0631209.1 NADH-quinone oxidoreductase subunit NuoH [Phycisphaerales bacterium]MCI0677249.1 NADH-quinone oxidoreductase subunit NuoH [Phycisphaerales bacterium]
MSAWISNNAQLVTSIIVILVVIHLALGAAAYLILLERKVAAWAQDRIGPNRVGPLGLLQPIADGLKLFLKEDYIPGGADRFLFVLAPGLSVIAAMIGFAVIPWAGTLTIGGQSVKVMTADISVGIVYLIATASLGVYGVALGGWASNSKYSFIGGLRASAQMISYEIPMGLAILCIILTAGSVKADEIVAMQIGPGHQWYILHQPLAAIIFYTCMLAEANRAPFDLAEAEAELVGGWHTEYSSMKWAMFFLGEYVHMFVGSAFFVTLFLGGWSLNPFGVGPDLPLGGGIGMILLQFGIVLGKVFLMIFLTMMVRWTLPRFRFDQLMRLSWEGMIPVSLLVLLVTSFMVFMGWIGWMWAASLATFAIIWLAHPLLPRQANPNRRIPLIGSRFSPLSDKALGP